MSFLKSLKKAANASLEVVSNAAELVALDRIVDDCVDHYDDEVNKYVQSCTHFISSEEAKRLEEEWMAKFNASYDRRAEDNTGRKVPDNWRDGGKDLVEVRKRILNRKFDDRRGKLYERINMMFQEGGVRVDHTQTCVKRNIEKFQSNAEYVMPLSDEALKSLITELSTNLDKWIVEYYPEGVEKFKEDSLRCKNRSIYNDFVEVVIPQVKVDLTNKNSQMTALLKKLYEDAMGKASAFKVELENKLPMPVDELTTLVEQDISEIIRQIDALYPKGKDAFDHAAHSVSNKSYLEDIRQRHQEVSQEVQALNLSSITLLEDTTQKARELCQSFLSLHQTSVPMSAAALQQILEQSHEQVLSTVSTGYSQPLAKFVADSKKVKGTSLLDLVLKEGYKTFADNLTALNEEAKLKLTTLIEQLQNQLTQGFQDLQACLPLHPNTLEDRCVDIKTQLSTEICNTYTSIEKLVTDLDVIQAEVTWSTLEQLHHQKSEEMLALNFDLRKKLQEETQSRMMQSMLEQMQAQCRAIIAQNIEQERNSNVLSFLTAEEMEAFFACVQETASTHIPK